MGIGVSIFLLAIGAILSFAIDGNVDGINLDAVGVILMLLGGIGLLVSFVLLNDTAPWRRTDRLRQSPPIVDQERVVYRDEVPAQQERVVYRDDVPAQEERVVYRDEAPAQQERVVHRGSRRA